MDSRQFLLLFGRQGNSSGGSGPVVKIVHRRFKFRRVGGEKCIGQGNGPDIIHVGIVIQAGVNIKNDRICSFFPGINQWYSLDPDQMAASLGLKNHAPMTFYEQDEHEGSGCPLPVDVLAYPDNNHLAYALFWFTMAAVLALIYSLRFILRSSRED